MIFVALFQVIKELKERKAQDKTENTENKENTDNLGNDTSLLNASTFSGFNMSASVSIPGLDLIDGENSPQNSGSPKNAVVNGDVNHRPTGGEESNVRTDGTQLTDHNGVTNEDPNVQSANGVSKDNDVVHTVKVYESDNKTDGTPTNSTRKDDAEDDLNPHNFSPKLALVDDGENVDMSAESADDRYKTNNLNKQFQVPHIYGGALV